MTLCRRCGTDGALVYCNLEMVDHALGPLYISITLGPHLNRETNYQAYNFSDAE